MILTRGKKDGVDFQQAIETQRLRLLRILAGLAVLLGVLAVGPVSRGFSDAVCRFVGSLLSRAELAARNLVIAEAGLIATRTNSDVERARLFDVPLPAIAREEGDCALLDLRARLVAVRRMLHDLPRYGLRLLRRAEKRIREISHIASSAPCPEDRTALDAWRLAEIRVERPPDKGRPTPVFITSPRQRAGGIGSCADALPLRKPQQDRS